MKKPLLVLSLTLLLGLNGCCSSLFTCSPNANSKPWCERARPCGPSPCSTDMAFTGTGYDSAGVSLAEASYSVSRSLVELDETSQAAHPFAKMCPPPNPASYGMAQLTSVDWSGPIEPLIRQIAKAANYRVSVLGTRPSIPIIVTLYKKNDMLADILRDASFQAGRRAEVVVYPESRAIELRYAKN